MFFLCPATGEMWLNNLDNAKLALRAIIILFTSRKLKRKRNKCVERKRKRKRALALSLQ
jgi:hypothetical protein